MARTLYAWQDKDTLKYYLSAFPPVMQEMLDNPQYSGQLTEAAKYRPAVEYDKLSDLNDEVERRKGKGRVPAISLKWDEGSGPNA